MLRSDHPLNGIILGDFLSHPTTNPSASPKCSGFLLCSESDHFSSLPLLLQVLDYSKSFQTTFSPVLTPHNLYLIEQREWSSLKLQVRSCFFFVPTFQWLSFSLKIKFQTLTWSIKSFWSYLLLWFDFFLSPLCIPVSPTTPALFSVPQTFYAFLHEAFVIVFSARKVFIQIPKWFSLFISSGLCSNIIFSVRTSPSTLHKIVHNFLMCPSFNIHFLPLLPYFCFIGRTYQHLKYFTFSCLCVFFPHLSLIDNVSSNIFSSL